MSVIINVILFFRGYFDAIVDWWFGLYFNRNREDIPSIKTPFLVESATSLAKKIKEGKLTSEEVVQGYINRINDVNLVINAVVDKRFQAALDEAKAVDKKIKNGEYTQEDFKKKPFLGMLQLLYILV